MEQKIYEDKEGKKIGTLNNLIDSFGNILFQIGMGLNDFFSGKYVEKAIIHDRINTYLAVRFCYDGTTSSIDNRINEIVREIPSFAEHIGYKPIT